jgi:hypothetical protein
MPQNVRTSGQGAEISVKYSYNDEIQQSTLVSISLKLRQKIVINMNLSRFKVFTNRKISKRKLPAFFAFNMAPSCYQNSDA